LQVWQQTKQGHYVVEVWLLDVKAITSVVMQLDFDNPQTARGKKILYARLISYQLVFFSLT
jgi:hypothetical protein